ncbi:hypothetical protein V2B37_00050 (plasmid) [Natranaerobius thermophilus JW/NM-WN-LF]
MDREGIDLARGIPTSSYFNGFSYGWHGDGIQATRELQGEGF